MIVNWSILVSHYPKPPGGQPQRDFLCIFLAWVAMAKSQRPVVMDKLSSSVWSTPQSLDTIHAVFKIEVLNALQTRFGPFKCICTSLKTTSSKGNPNLKMKTSLEFLHISAQLKNQHKRRALSLQEVELDGWFLILHVVMETCIIWKYSTSLIWVFLFHFDILRLTFWSWTNPSTEGLEFESPSKWNSYEGFDLEHCIRVVSIMRISSFFITVGDG
jgi:hypothetical protein